MEFFDTREEAEAFHLDAYAEKYWRVISPP